jgi:methanogenic corrinoid protein MtbC1
LFDSSVANEFFACAVRGDEHAALRRLRMSLAGGVDRRTLVEEVVVPALQRVGDDWEANRAEPAAMQRVATVAQRALDEIARLRVAHRHEGVVLVGCAPGERHVVAGRVVFELLRADGWDVQFFGMAPSAAYVADEARTTGAKAVVLSSTLARNLPAVSKTVDAVHLARVPVLVGGRAFGPDDARARALAADGWASAARDASLVLAQWARQPVALGPVSGLGFEPVLDEPARASIVDAALRVLARDMPLGGAPADALIDADDLDRLLDLAEIAGMTADERVLRDDVEWWCRYLAARGVPARAAGSAIEALAGAAPPGVFRSRLLRVAQHPGDARPDGEIGRAASF